MQCVAGAVDQRIWTDPGAVSDQAVALSLVAGWNNFISLAVCDATNCTVRVSTTPYPLHTNPLTPSS